MGAVPEHAGVQGRLVRAGSDRGRPLLPLFQAVLHLRHRAAQDAAARTHLDLRLRNDPRPGRERSEEPAGRRTDGDSLWSWCKTSTENSGRAVGDEAGSPTARAVGIPLVYEGEEVNRSLCLAQMPAAERISDGRSLRRVRSTPSSTSAISAIGSRLDSL